MGYETSLHLIGASVAAGRREQVRKALKKACKGKDHQLVALLEQVDFSSSGTLEFLHGEDSVDEPDDEGFVVAIWGKHYGAEAFAKWLACHCDEGEVILHSREGDGEAWGWEFKKGRIRALRLQPVGTWKTLTKKRRGK